MIDVSTPKDGKIRKKEHETVTKCQQLKRVLERSRQVKARAVCLVIGVLGLVTPKVKEMAVQNTWRYVKDICPEEHNPISFSSKKNLL